MAKQDSAKPQSESRVDITIAEMYGGPVLNPPMLRAFEDVVPGSAKDLMDESVAMMAHARWADRQRVRTVVWSHMGWQIGRWVMMLILVGLGVYLLMNKHSPAGYILMTAGVGPNAVAAVVPLFRRRNGERNGSSQ